MLACVTVMADVTAYCHTGYQLGGQTLMLSRMLNKLRECTHQATTRLHMVTYLDALCRCALWQDARTML